MLGAVHDELARRGGTLLAISTDSVEQARELHADLDLPFPVLSDAGALSTRAYGLVHARGGPGRVDVALPAQALLDGQRRIVWRHVARRIQDRPSPRDVLEAIRAAFP